MEELNSIFLIDEFGEEIEFVVLDFVEFEDKEYAIMSPIDEDDDEADEVVIFEVSPLNEEEDDYIGIEDEDLLYKVFNVFKEKHKDKFKFVD